MNYNTLAKQIETYANKVGDARFTSNIENFIELGQQRIWRELKDIGFEEVKSGGKFVVNTAFIEKPADWNKTISLIYGTTNSAFDNSTLMYLRTYEFCRAYWPNASNGDINNPPLFYSDHIKANSFGEEYFFLSPTPFEAFKYQLTYLKRPDLITQGIETNILTDRFPDLLFYACFLEALTYLKDDERVPVFESLYNRALQSANNQTQERYTDRTSKRDKD